MRVIPWLHRSAVTAFCLFLPWVSPPLLADEPLLRPSAKLLFKHPELLRAGSCVRYQEGGSGWIITEPAFYLQGVIEKSEVQTRRLMQCPTVPGKNPEHYSRSEYTRLLAAYPCLSAGEPAREEQIGVVHLRVTAWETPHARQSANRGRLFRGHYLDQALETSLPLAIEADLLQACTP